MVKATRSGYLLIESLVAIAVLTGLIGIVIPFIQSMELSLSKRQKILDLMALNASLDDQFQAQFQRLGSVGCFSSNEWLEVGNGQSKPARLTTDQLDLGSDWLYGKDFGLCAAYGWSDEHEIDVNMACEGIGVGDSVHVSSCDQSSVAKVLSSNNGVLKAWNTGPALTGEVLVYSAEGFYWFVKEGKSQFNAFWRRPEKSGNALELMTGLEHVRFYPVLDRNLDGIADEVLVDYGTVPTAQLVGILVEYLYGAAECELAAQSQSYQTLRGDQWHYDGLCFKVGKLLASVGKTNET
ncbi:type II secretion system protein [Marinomonas fungiae]|uniref:Uncharacterized protein n=1 Tax=Marinomonas fungiae TaxID=1137284 RepID=A0A0K6IGH8_9GAMM|nr:type II secretion system protein [Marinomonas fungiae]CUB02457.1 hypothetical protein Ga0061065_101290 [Marinomonas fungiae]